MSAVKVDDTLVAAAAAELNGRLGELGARPGDRIAIYCDNGLAFVVARDAITALEGVAVPLNPRLTAGEVDYVLAHSGARLLLADEAHETRARTAAASLPDCAVAVVSGQERAGGGASAETRPTRIGATLIYTSGTTGLPKGCLRLEAEEMARARELIDSYTITGDDVHLIACPLAHSAPGIFLRAGRFAGAATYILPRFRAEEFLATVDRVGATLFFLVPTQYERLLALPDDVRARYDLSSIRAALVAGAPMQHDTKRRLVDWLGPQVLWEFYGSSETGTISVLSPEDQLRRPGSAGKPVCGVELRLVDEQGNILGRNAVGEIYVRSPTVMTGYLDEPANDRDGFISVGDLGRLDDDGYLYLVDRKHDTIISGGLNVYPAEVERALHRHPAVRGAVAFGVDDPDWGQIVAAAVVVDGEVTAAELRAYLRDKIAAYKLPKAIALLGRDELPVGASGKPLRRKARAMLAGSDRLLRCD